jgi:hypothetical protein
LLHQTKAHRSNEHVICRVRFFRVTHRCDGKITKDQNPDNDARPRGLHGLRRAGSMDAGRRHAVGASVRRSRSSVSSCRLSTSTQQERLQALQQRLQAVHAFHSECHFFAIAAYKLLEYRGWVLTFGLCASVNFAEIDRFSAQDIRDLRDMREHVVDYFSGRGWFPDRWFVETPDFRADASSGHETMIGGRLDWVAFGAAAERLLPQLLAEPIPWPPAAIMTRASRPG